MFRRFSLKDKKYNNLLRTKYVNPSKKNIHKGKIQRNNRTLTRLETNSSQTSILSKTLYTITNYSKSSNENLNTYQKTPIHRNSKSMINNNNTTKNNNNFYYLICKNCFDKNKAIKNLKKIKNQGDKKDLLNKTFNQINPYIFQDEMNQENKNRIINKMKERENKINIVKNKLEYDKLNNPTAKEALQIKNENSIDPLNNQKNIDPRYEKTKKRYENKERLILNNRDSYNINQPRKAIQDYYNKVQYEVPILEYSLGMSEECKQNYINELKKQIKEKNDNLKREQNEQLLNEKKANKEYINYLKYTFNKDNYDKYKKQKEFNEDNNKLIEFKKRKEEEEKNNRKIYEKKLNEQINKEIEQEYYDNLNKRLDEIEQFNFWQKEAEKLKEKEKEKEKEDRKKWKNYEEEFEIKCIHGNNIYKCSICNRTFKKDQLIKVRVNNTNSNYLKKYKKIK